MITDQIKQQVTDKLNSCLAVVNQRFNKNILLPPVDFDCNDSRGGYYSQLKGSLHFNPTLFLQNFQHYLANVVPHELAHFVQHVLYPDSLKRQISFSIYGSMKRTKARPHGREWQMIMRIMGAKPERCHSYDTSDVPMRRVFKKVSVYCNCSEHKVTNRIVVKLEAGRTYTCRLCGSKISLTKPLTPALQPV